MSEMRRNTPKDHRENRPVGIAVHTLAPNQRLYLPPGDVTVLVTEGLLYIVLDDEDLALIPGEEVVIPAGRLQFAWNAGTDVAKIAALRR
jgi:quercetin dioxygenase-like cupin family protein